MTKRVTITIDVENPQTPLFENKFSDNRIWSDGNGIEKIISIFNKFNLKASFFVNVYEYKIWGINEIKRIINYIHDSGYDVELHTHPIWVDEKRRENMFQFPLFEQNAIIKWGLDFIEDTIGIRPIAHRAGAYGFNQDTLTACEEQGMSIDSSNFFGHKFCKTIVTMNNIVKTDNLYQVPVTFFKKGEKIVKTDLNWINENELNLLLKHKSYNFINFFMHSYSLTKTKDNYSTYEVDDFTTRKLENMLLNIVNTPDLEVLTLKELITKNRI